MQVSVDSSFSPSSLEDLPVDLGISNTEAVHVCLSPEHKSFNMGCSEAEKRNTAIFTDKVSWYY